MSAKCVLWYVLRANIGLFKHAEPLFPTFTALAHVSAIG